MDNEKEIAILNERTENLKDRIARFTSHLESEQRVTGNISKRVDQVELTQKYHQELLSKFDRMLLNEGRGLTFKVDRLEHQEKNRRWNVGVIMGIFSLLVSIGTAIIMIVK